VCTVATWYWSFFTQAAVMNMVYPLFILVACKSNPQKVYQKGEEFLGMPPGNHCDPCLCL
jgi:hypothetical protein